MYISDNVLQASPFLRPGMHTVKRVLLGLLILLTYLCISSGLIVQAKPMPAPTLEEAVASEIIVVAEYIGFENRPFIGYFTGTKAFYRVKEIIKGQSVDEYVKLKYSFTDGSACLLPGDWRFSSKLMPKEGSLWVLFLKDSDDNGIFETYRGDYGRWEATEKNIKDVKASVISKYGSLSSAKPHKSRRPIIINYYFAVVLFIVLMVLYKTRISRKHYEKIDLQAK